MVTLSSSNTYFQNIQSQIGFHSLWDYLRYDEHGELWINSLKLSDLVSQYGSPLEIHDMTIMKRRSDFWKELVGRVSDSCGYSGSFSYYYASKANMSLPYVLNAYRNGWMAETSSAQDLVHLLYMYQHKMITTDISIICNGFKFPSPEGVSELPGTYASYILKLHNLGFQVVPIFDSGEVAYFAQHVTQGSLDVGLRLKFGIVHDDEHLVRGISRHGMSWDELEEAALLINRHEHLQLTMLHAMVSAAIAVPVDEMVSSLLYGAEKFFELKRKYPSLKYLNIGGGIPPVVSGYEYETFLRRLLEGITRLSKKYDCDVPDIVFEFGSFLSEECGFYVHRVIQRKHNSMAHDEGELNWAIVDGGLMAELPDMFITQKSFPVIAGNNAHQKPEEFILGDLSCDSDGRYPKKKAVPQSVLLPDAENQLVVIPCVGAYQKMLSGAGGAHHCGILNSGQVIVEEENGEVRTRFIPPQSEEEYAHQLGYGMLHYSGAKAKKSWWRSLISTS